MTATPPRIFGRTETCLSPWTTVIARNITMPGAERPSEYHSLRQADYVTVLAITPDRHIPLVRQYRPALEAYTLELPGGLRDGNEAPEIAARREMREETGFVVSPQPYLLGCLAPDSGRLENRLWGFLAHTSETDPEWKPEPAVERIMVPARELREWIINGKFDMALHIALIGLALMKGVFTWE